MLDDEWLRFRLVPANRMEMQKGMLVLLSHWESEIATKRLNYDLIYRTTSIFFLLMIELLGGEKVVVWEEDGLCTILG